MGREREGEKHKERGSVLRGDFNDRMKESSKDSREGKNKVYECGRMRTKKTGKSLQTVDYLCKIK